MKKITILVGPNNSGKTSLATARGIYDELIYCERNQSYADLIPGVCYMLHQPEVGMYPTGQANLANTLLDLFFRLDADLVIETHSEYLIRKFQLLVAQGKISTELIDIVYFYGSDVPEGENREYIIKIDADGKLSKSFGKGFYDEACGLDLELYLIR